MHRRSLHVLLAGLLALSAVAVPGLAPPEPVAAVDPTPGAPMAMRLEAGHHKGYTFNASGWISGSRAATIATPSTIQTTRRASIGTRGPFLLMSTGPMAGYWIRESIVAHVIGPTAVRKFTPPRSIALPVGTVLGYKFTLTWGVISAPVLTVTSASSATATRSAVINGVLYYLIADGPLANTWVPSGGADRARILSCRTGPRAGGGAAVWTRLTGAGPEVALTFDLGGRIEPAMAIAKRLLLNGVCATIFPTGDAVAGAGAAVVDYLRHYPALFEFGNHTKDHCDLVHGGGDTGCPAARQPASFVQSQLTSANVIIEAATGQSTIPYWRPPYGSHDQAVRTAAAQVGYTKTVMWHIDTIDWRPPPPTDTGPTTVQIIDKVVGNAADGSIVLMHLGGWNTHAALPGMINGLRGRGFAATTLSDLADGQ